MNLLKTKTGGHIKFLETEKGWLILSLGRERINNMGKIGYFPTKWKALEFYEEYLKPKEL